MPTSATGKAEGFTLVELLVVLVIVGLVSGAVLLAVPDPRGSLEAEAERFAARARAAQERAVMDNRAVALRVTPEGYAFEWRVEGEWQPLGQRPFGSYAWGEGVAAALEPEGERILFDSTGFAEPARLALTRDGESAAVEVADGGEIRVAR